MRRARPTAPSSTNSSCASSTRTACRSGSWSGRRRRRAATSIRNRCSAAKSIGRRWASSIRASRRCSTNTAIWSRDAARRRSRRSFGSAARCTARRVAPASATNSPRARCRSRASSGRRKTSNCGRRRSPMPARRWPNTASPIAAARARQGALVLAVRPVQINPYWQHGGHAPIGAIAVEGDRLWVDDRLYAAFSRQPDAAAVADFDGGDVVRLIDAGPRETGRSVRSASGLASAACEFAFSLQPGESMSVVVAAPMRDGVAPRADVAFDSVARRRSPRLARKARPAPDRRRRPGGQRHARSADRATSW